MFSGFSFPSVFLGDGVAFFDVAFFFFGKPLLLYIVVGTYNLIKYLYIKDLELYHFTLIRCHFIMRFMFYIFSNSISNSMENYNFLLPFKNLTVLVHLRFI